MHAKDFTISMKGMPKGKKEDVQAHAARHGISVNAYINAAIDEKMARDTATE